MYDGPKGPSGGFREIHAKHEQISYALSIGRLYTYELAL